MKQNKKHRKDEIFVVDIGAGTKILYAPLRKRLVTANDEAIGIVADYCQGKLAAQGPYENQIISTLIEEGVIGGAVPDFPTHPENYPFCPHEVTLFLTSRCNLCCRYCYADAGKKTIDMPLSIAKAGIDLVANNAGILGHDTFAVGFHGGGEPTVAWELLVECCDYAKHLANQKGLKTELFAATNGVFDADKRNYITKTFKTVNISLDGPEDIQDYNRPRLNGQGSYQMIRENLLYFDKIGFHYGIRATVLSRNVGRIEEIAEHICKTFRPAYLHIEPAWFCGRCISSNERPPEDDDFVNGFLRAKAMGTNHGINVHYSGARLDVLTSKFCGAPGDSFTVLPEGTVTSCYEITDLKDQRANIFHYGQYDFKTDRFCFNQQRIESLRKLSVDNLPFCEDCFCRWHCAGDCIAKAMTHGNTVQHQGTERCMINRKLLSTEISEIVHTVKAERSSSGKENHQNEKTE